MKILAYDADTLTRRSLIRSGHAILFNQYDRATGHNRVSDEQVWKHQLMPAEGENTATKRKYIALPQPKNEQLLLVLLLLVVRINKYRKHKRSHLKQTHAYPWIQYHSNIHEKWIINDRLNPFESEYRNSKTKQNEVEMWIRTETKNITREHKQKCTYWFKKYNE